MFGKIGGYLGGMLGTAAGSVGKFTKGLGASAAIGAGIGAYQGIDNGFGGFVGGAAMGALGGAAFKKWGAGRNLMSRGLGSTMGGIGKLASNTSSPMLARGAAGLTRMGGSISPFVNKHGDKMLMGLGAASAGLIGSSALSSNSSY